MNRVVNTVFHRLGAEINIQIDKSNLYQVIATSSRRQGHLNVVLTDSPISTTSQWIVLIWNRNCDRIPTHFVIARDQAVDRLMEIVQKKWKLQNPIDDEDDVVMKVVRRAVTKVWDQKEPNEEETALQGLHALLLVVKTMLTLIPKYEASEQVITLGSKLIVMRHYPANASRPSVLKRVELRLVKTINRVRKSDSFALSLF